MAERARVQSRSAVRSAFREEGAGSMFQPRPFTPPARKVGRGSPGDILQRADVAGVEVLSESGYPAFRINDKKYHINEGIDMHHITCDTDGRTHYYYTGTGNDIQDAVGPGKVKKNKKKIKFKFSELPSEVKKFIKKNYQAIVRVTEKGVINA